MRRPVFILSFCNIVFVLLVIIYVELAITLTLLLDSCVVDRLMGIIVWRCFMIISTSISIVINVIL